VSCGTTRLRALLFTSTIAFGTTAMAAPKTLLTIDCGIVCNGATLITPAIQKAIEDPRFACPSRRSYRHHRQRNVQRLPQHRGLEQLPPNPACPILFKPGER
jgi:hypothetical protein